MNEDVDKLGEKLYYRIYTKHQETAGKITGMLLELPCPVLSQMLQDEAMLTAAIDKALQALQEANEPSKTTTVDRDDMSTSSDSLGEQLFEFVELYNTGHSQKITGMLLELHKDAVLKLLSDPKLLEEKVNQALEMLKQEKVEKADHSDSCDEELGERLFSLVYQLNQEHANDITGMLLEMDHPALQQLLNDHSMLEVAVKKALAALGI